MKGPFPNRFSPPLGAPPLSARARVLAQWRGFDASPLETARRAGLPAAQVVPRLLKEIGIDNRRMDAEIIKVWNTLLDPNIVAHAQPTGLRKGTLFVSVDNSAWLSEIVRYRRKEILDRLQHSFGREFITRISFKVL